MLNILHAESNMDPLGARDDILNIEEFTRWNQTQLPVYSERDSAEELVASAFPWRNDLNSKIVLWNGDVTRLNVHAIVHATNEHMNDRSEESDAIFRKAGPELYKEIQNNIRRCKTGEAKITKGHNLPSRHIIHSVGPRFNIKYVTAAESALYSSYRNTLQLCREYALRTVGLCCIHTMRRGYPSESGAHIAIRTTRRFLEKFGDDFDTVVFVCTEETIDVYKGLLPLYFPRNIKEEVYAASLLPRDVGNEDGEPIIVDRQIRILDKPAFAALKASGCEDFEETIDLNRAFMTSTALDVGHHPFAQMEENPDQVKRSHLYGKSSTEQRRQEMRRRYERFLKRAKTEDLTDIASLRCLYRSGVDRIGRPVVVFVGKNFPATTVDPERALLYLVRVMDPVVDKDYVVVYFHTQTNASNHPAMNYLKFAYSLLDHRYKKNLKAFYVIHPTWWSKLATWVFTTFTASDIKGKVHSLAGVQFLYTKMNPDQLDVPPFVLDYDIQVNGHRYHVPSEDTPEGL